MTDIIKDDIPFLENCFESAAHNYIKKLGSAYVDYLFSNFTNNYCDTPTSKVFIIISKSWVAHTVTI